MQITRSIKYSVTMQQRQRRRALMSSSRQLSRCKAAPPCLGPSRKKKRPSGRHHSKWSLARKDHETATKTSLVQTSNFMDCKHPEKLAWNTWLNNKSQRKRTDEHISCLHVWLTSPMTRFLKRIGDQYRRLTTRFRRKTSSKTEFFSEIGKSSSKMSIINSSTTDV